MRVTQSDYSIAERQQRKRHCCRISTMVLVATVMGLGVLCIGLVGFLPTYIVGFTAATNAISAIRSQAVNGFLASTNNAVKQLPMGIYIISINYVLGRASNITFFPDDKNKLLFSVSNVLSKKMYRESVSYFMIANSGGESNNTWGIFSSTSFQSDFIAGAVMQGLNHSPIYLVDPVNISYTEPKSPIANYNVSLVPYFGNSYRRLKEVAQSWNDGLENNILYRTHWSATDKNISSTYFDFVQPYHKEKSSGFCEVALRASTLDIQVLLRAFGERGRVMILDFNSSVVVANNWNQTSMVSVSDNNGSVVPLTVDLVNDTLMREMVHIMDERGGFETVMNRLGHQEFTFRDRGSTAHAHISRLEDDRGLNYLICIATIESDLFGSMLRGRIMVAITICIAVTFVTLFAVAIACGVFKPLKKLIPALQRASTLQLQGKEDNVWERSIIPEVQDIQDGYAELIRQLLLVKAFVQEAILARGPNTPDDGVDHKNGPHTHSNVHIVKSASINQGISTGEKIHESSQFSKSRQEMRLNNRIFKEPANGFTRRYCTVVLIENSNSESHCEYFDSILRCATRLNGCVEYLRPDRTLVTFGAHSPLPMHSSKGCRFAFDLFEELNPCDQESVTILVDSNELLVGTWGYQSRNEQVTVGVVGLREIINVMICDGCHIAATAGAASQLQDFYVLPIDCVLLPFSSVPMVLSELRPQTSTWKGKTNTTKHFRLGFAAMRQGYYKQAMAHYQKIGKSDPQAHRLIRLCAQRCLSRDTTPYVRETGDLYSIGSYLAPSSGTRGKANASLEIGVLKDTLPYKSCEAADNRAREQGHSSNEDGGALFEMYQPSSSSEFENEFEDSHGTDDMPLLLTDINQKVWSRSLKMISEGAFSSVYLGMSEDGVQVAIKCIPRRRRDIMPESLEAEMNIASKLRHPNVVQYVSCSVIQSHLAIIMEYLPGGSVYSVIKNFGKLSPRVARRFTVDILNGLNYLHGLGVVHCDVKPHNVLLGMDGVCKLSDFGSTITEARDMVRKGMDDVVLRGTALYMSPEVASGERCTAQSDIYSLGITLLEMLLGRPPWRWSSTAPDRNDGSGLRALLNRDALFVRSLARGHLEPEIPEFLDREAAIFVRYCCNKDPASRPTALELLSYAFVL